MTVTEARKALDELVAHGLAEQIRSGPRAGAYRLTAAGLAFCEIDPEAQRALLDLSTSRDTAH